MKRVEGTSGIKLIECVSPARNRWRIRWDVQEREDGSASYMEEGFVGRPHMDTIKSVITDWCNEQIDREILSGFLYEGMPVWLSSENQFNYKAAYDLAVQTGGATLPVTFKFGTDEVPQYREFVTLEELTDFYTKAMKHVQDTLSDGWRKKDAFDPEEVPGGINPSGEDKKKAPGLLKSNANHFYKHETPNRATGGKYPLSRFDVFFVV